MHKKESEIVQPIAEETPADKKTPKIQTAEGWKRAQIQKRSKPKVQKA